MATVKSTELQLLVKTAQAQAKETREELTHQVFDLKRQLMRLKDRIDRGPRVEAAIMKLGTEWDVDLTALENRDMLGVLQAVRHNLQNQLIFKSNLHASTSREDQEAKATTAAVEDIRRQQVEMGTGAPRKAVGCVTGASTDILEQAMAEEKTSETHAHAETKALHILKKSAEEQEDKVRMVNLELLRISEMEHQLENYRHELDAELQRRKQKHQLHQNFLKKRRMHLAKVEAEKHDLAQKIKHQRQRLHGYQQNVKLKRSEENETQGTQATAVLRSIEAQLIKINGLVDKTQNLIDERNQQIHRMKIERKKLLKPATVEQFRKPTTSEAHKQANRHPYLIQIFRTKLQNKEKEKAALSKKIKRLLAEKHDYLTRKNEYKHEAALNTQLQLGFRSNAWSSMEQRSGSGVR